MESRRTARATYDRLSAWYDLLAGSEQQFVRLGLEMLNARPGEWLVEIGPGTGHALETLGRAVGTTGGAVGIDLSPGMLRRAGERLARAGLGGMVRLACGDAVSLPLPSGAFDAAFLSFSLELFDPPAMALVLGECRRVLRPGGRIAIVSLSCRRQGSPGAAQGSPAMRRLYAWAHARFPAWVDCRPIDAGQALEEGGFRLTASALHPMWGLPVEIVLGVRET